MKLEDIAEINIGCVLGRNKSVYKSKEKYKYKLFNLMSYENRIDFESFYSDNDLNNYIVHKGDLLIRLAFPFKIIEVDELIDGTLISNQYCIIRINSKKYDNAFLLWYFMNEKTQYELERDSFGTAVKTMPVSKLREIEIPNLSEEELKILLSIITKWNEQKKKYENLVEEKNKYYNFIINNYLKKGD